MSETTVTSWEEYRAVLDEEDGWFKEALCAGYPTDVFYPSTDSEASEAKSICRKCRVRKSCLEWAIVMREENGVWGGASEKERPRLRRKIRNRDQRNLIRATNTVINEFTRFSK